MLTAGRWFRIRVLEETFDVFNVDISCAGNGWRRLYHC